MLKTGVPSKPKSYLPFLILLAVLAFFLPRTAKFAFDYRKGSPWKYDSLVSQFDFPIYKTEEQVREEMSASESEAVPYYKYSNDVLNGIIRDVQSLQFGEFAGLRNYIISDIKDIYVQGVLSDRGVQLDRHSSVDVMYIQKDKQSAKYPISEVIMQSDARSRLLSDVYEHFPDVNVDSLFRKLDVLDFIVPNLVYDQQTTDLLHSESAREFSPTQGYVSAGTLIVSNGEIVTAETARILDSYRYEYEDRIGYSGPRFAQWAGNVILAFALVLLLVLAILMFKPNLFRHFNQLCFIATLFGITGLASTFIDGSHQFLFYLMPYTLCAICLRAFYDKPFSAAIYTLALLPLIISANEGMELYVMFLFSGYVTIFLYEFFGKGWKLFVLALVSFLAVTLVYISYVLGGELSGAPLRVVGLLFVGSMISVAGYPFTLLFERIFNLVSDSRLEELVDTDNKLLRELEEKAPGTFQHSLHVMNMAEAAARSIGANVQLVRAGSLYHDIGKMKNPVCFVENEALFSNESDRKYHSSLTPQQSAADIIRHVDDGIELAEQYRLPHVVSNFIKTHHGNSVAGFFYNKYVNEGGDPDNVEAFSYHGMRPQTKEQIIVMLCDAVEAASRTLKYNTPEAYSELVESIYATKSSQNQFDEANISIKEINLVKEELKTYLAQMYHERVVYPKRKKQ